MERTKQLLEDRITKEDRDLAMERGIAAQNEERIRQEVSCLCLENQTLNLQLGSRRKEDVAVCRPKKSKDCGMNASRSDSSWMKRPAGTRNWPWNSWRLRKRRTTSWGSRITRRWTPWWRPKRPGSNRISWPAKWNKSGRKKSLKLSPKWPTTSKCCRRRKSFWTGCRAEWKRKKRRGRWKRVRPSLNWRRQNRKWIFGWSSAVRRRRHSTAASKLFKKKRPPLAGF